jgi:hypothetical protein
VDAGDARGIATTRQKVEDRRQKGVPMKLLAVIAACALTAAAVAAAPSVTGTWSMSVDSPHGAATMGLVLKQDGTKVAGTFASGHSPDMALEGEFADGTLKLDTTEGGDAKIMFTGKLKDDGTLAGYLSSQMGDMKWTATRVPEQKKDGK